MKKIIILLIVAYGSITHAQISITLAVDSSGKTLNLTYLNENKWAGNVYFPKILTESNCFPKSATVGMAYGHEKCYDIAESTESVLYKEMYYVIITPDEMLVKTVGGFLYKNYDGEDFQPKIVNSIMRYIKEVDKNKRYHTFDLTIGSIDRLTPDDILSQYREEFVFLKPGESYTESFSIESFFKTGASFSFYINDSWRVTNEGDIITWPFCHYADVIQRLPQNVGEYNIYDGFFYANHAEIITSK